METNTPNGVRKWVEFTSYCILVLGTLGDSASTHLGLAYYGLNEVNPFAIQLIDSGLWPASNLAIIALGVVVPFITIRYTNMVYARCFLSFPMIHGVIRLVACIWNCSLML